MAENQENPVPQLQTVRSFAKNESKLSINQLREMGINVVKTEVEVLKNKSEETIFYNPGHVGDLPVELFEAGGLYLVEKGDGTYVPFGLIGPKTLVESQLYKTNPEMKTSPELVGDFGPTTSLHDMVFSNIRFQLGQATHETRLSMLKHVLGLKKPGISSERENQLNEIINSFQYDVLNGLKEDYNQATASQELLNMSNGDHTKQRGLLEQEINRVLKKF